MPNVDGKKFPYTKEGKEAAKKARKDAISMMRSKSKKKSNY
jgi:hypothetical protein